MPAAYLDLSLKNWIWGLNCTQLYPIRRMEFRTARSIIKNFFSRNDNQASGLAEWFCLHLGACSRRTSSWCIIGCSLDDGTYLTRDLLTSFFFFCSTLLLSSREGARHLARHVINLEARIYICIQTHVKTWDRCTHSLDRTHTCIGNMQKI